MTALFGCYPSFIIPCGNFRWLRKGTLPLQQQDPFLSCPSTRLLWGWSRKLLTLLTRSMSLSCHPSSWSKSMLTTKEQNNSPFKITDSFLYLQPIYRDSMKWVTAPSIVLSSSLIYHPFLFWPIPTTQRRTIAHPKASLVPFLPFNPLTVTGWRGKQLLLLFLVLLSVTAHFHRLRTGKSSSLL